MKRARTRGRPPRADAGAVDRPRSAPSRTLGSRSSSARCTSAAAVCTGARASTPSPALRRPDRATPSKRSSVDRSPPRSPARRWSSCTGSTSTRSDRGRPPVRSAPAHEPGAAPVLPCPMRHRSSSARRASSRPLRSFAATVRKRGGCQRARSPLSLHPIVGRRVDLSGRSVSYRDRLNACQFGRGRSVTIG